MKQIRLTNKKIYTQRSLYHRSLHQCQHNQYQRHLEYVQYDLKNQLYSMIGIHRNLLLSV